MTSQEHNFVELQPAAALSPATLWSGLPDVVLSLLTNTLPGCATVWLLGISWGGYDRTPAFPFALEVPCCQVCLASCRSTSVACLHSERAGYTPQR